MMKIKLSKDIHVAFGTDLMLSVLRYVVWASVLLQFVRGVCYRLTGNEQMGTLGMALCVIIPLLLSLPVLLNRFTLWDYLFYSLNVVYVLVCYAVFPENEKYLDEETLNCIFCIFPFYFFGRIVDIDTFFNRFLLLSTFSIILYFLYVVIYQSGQSAMGTEGEQRMYEAYRILPHLLLVTWSMLEKFRIWKAATVAVGIMFLFSCGTRGPFLCIMLFGIIYALFYMNFRGAIYVKMGMVGLIVLFLVMLRDILFYAAKTLVHMNLSTRIIEKYIDGAITNDSGRASGRAILYGALERNDHFLGLGMFGCRNYGIIYPHFLPQDFLCTYGYVLGSLLLVALIVLVAWAFYRAKGGRRRVFIIFLFCVSIVKLMLSNTFLLEPYFYFLVGYCVTMLIQSPEPRVIETK